MCNRRCESASHFASTRLPVQNIAGDCSEGLIPTFGITVFANGDSLGNTGGVF